MHTVFFAIRIGYFERKREKRRVIWFWAQIPIKIDRIIYFEKWKKSHFAEEYFSPRWKLDEKYLFTGLKYRIHRARYKGVANSYSVFSFISQNPFCEVLSCAEQWFFIIIQNAISQFNILFHEKCSFISVIFKNFSTLHVVLCVNVKYIGQSFN